MVSEFVVAGEVRGQMRPRTRIAGGHATIYKDPADRAWESRILAEYVAQCGGRLHTGEVAVEIVITRALPRSVRDPDPDTHKPDVDNVAKSVLDALSGTAFTDDRYVTDLHVTKTMRAAGSVDVMVVRVMDVER